MKLDDLKRFGARAMKVGNELATLVVAMENATPAKIAAVGFKAIHTYVTAHPSVEHYVSGWPHLGELYFMAHDLRRICVARGELIARTQCEDDRFVEEYSLGGTRLAFEDAEHMQGPWVRPPDSAEQGRVALARLIWEDTGPAMTVEAARDWDPDLKLLPDVLAQKQERTSAIGVELHEWCSKFARAGVPRSVLLYGPPGSGKSTAMRYVAGLSGGFSLRLDCSRIVRLGEANLGHLLTALRPNTVLLDDLDRGNTSEILSSIEMVRESCRLLLASANDLTKLDPAVIRVGRFDRLVELTTMDADVLDALLAGVAPEVRERLAALPVAYVDEFALRARILGVDAAIADVEELATRAADIEARMAPKEAPAGEKSTTP